MPKATAKIFSFILFKLAELNHLPPQRLRGFKTSPVREMPLRSYEYFVHMCIEDKPTMGDFRAVELLVRWIRAADKTGGLMWISFPGRVS